MYTNINKFLVKLSFDLRKEIFSKLSFWSPYELFFSVIPCSDKRLRVSFKGRTVGHSPLTNFPLSNISF